jgi:cobalt/nickel transport system permease protein
VHIPDGFLDTKTAVTTAVLSAAAVGVAVRQARISLPPRSVPTMGLAAAFVFAAQMLNFPVAAGTSGHLMGAVLSAVLLGPAGGMLVMTSVLIVQSLLFADGGLVALGANVLNMAVVATSCGYGIYRLVLRAVPGDRGRVAAVAFASWCSTVIAAICCAGELAWSGTAPWGIAFPAMANVHMLIGIGEALITALVIVALARVRPELLKQGMAVQSRGSAVMYGVVLVIGLVVFVSPFASPWPDGLAKVAEVIGFDQRALEGAGHAAIMPEYQVPGLGSAAAATVIAGALGTIAAFGLSFILAKLLIPPSHSNL